MQFPFEEVRKRLKQIAYETNRKSKSPHGFNYYSFEHNAKAGIFTAQTLDNKTHIGWHFCPLNTVAGDRFHFDHGVGINKNQDGQYLWVAPLTSLELNKIFSNPEKFVHKSFSGIFTFSDGTRKMSKLEIPNHRLDLPAQIYLDHNVIADPGIIKSISCVPSESLDIWKSIDETPKDKSKILSWDSDKVRKNHITPPHYDVDTFDLSGKSNGFYQNYHGPMVGALPWVSKKSWAYFDDLCDITMGDEFASLVTDKKITTEPDFSHN